MKADGRRRWIAAAVGLAAVPQLVVFALQIRTARYSPGASYRPRVEAVIAASRTGALGGPFVAVKTPAGFSLAPGLLNDLGMGALADLWGRFLHRPLTTSGLAVVNLCLMAAAFAVLVLAVPWPHRRALVPLFLLVPIAVREYRSPDSVTIHGALAAMAVAVALAAHHRWRLSTAVPAGVLLFAIHKLRSPFAVYAIAAALAAALVVALRARDRRPLIALVITGATFAALEMPWRIALDRRVRDPRVIERDVLPGHNVYNPLISGIGWTPNRWGIKPWDPWVATFLAERTAQDPVDLATFESERRARLVYFNLWREAPRHLLALYAARLPGAANTYVWLGALGALVWTGVFLYAGVHAWGSRDGPTMALLLAPAVVAVGMLVQIVLIDPRLMYSYPLRFVSRLDCGRPSA